MLDSVQPGPGPAAVYGQTERLPAENLVLDRPALGEPDTGPAAAVYEHASYYRDYNFPRNQAASNLEREFRNSPDALRHIPMAIMAAYGEERPELPAPAEDTPPLPRLEKTVFNLVNPDPPPILPPFIVDNLIPLDVGAFIGTGGLGKSTLLLRLSISISLGLPVFGHEVLKPGPVVYVSAEDDNEAIHWRLMNICLAMGLSDNQRRDLELPETQLIVTSLVGTGRKLVVNDGRGNFEITRLVDEIISLYRDVRPALIILDPLQQLAMGLETSPNESMREVVTAARRIKAALGCAVIIVHHVSKDVQRNRIIDHHSGRGGAALGDDARAVYVMVSMNELSARKYGVDADADDLEAGRYLEIHIPKLSYAPKPGKPIVLFRAGNGFEFEEIPIQAPADRTAAKRDAAIRQDQADEQALQTYLEESTCRYTVNSLESHAHAVGIPEKRLRRAAQRLLDKGILQEISLEQKERQGRRQSYLALSATLYQSGKEGS